MTNGLKMVLVGLGVGLALIGLITTMRMVGARSRGRLRAEENGVDEDARARMDAEGGAMQPIPTHIH